MDLIIATLLVLLVIVSALAQDFSIFSWAYWQEGGASTSRSEVVRNLGLLAAGMIGLGFGIWRAWTAYLQTQASQRQAEAANDQARAANEQARIAQQGHITDRFSTAVEHLGSEQLPVRLGGIYALWRLIKDSPGRDVTSVIDILCAFVRHPPHENAQGSDPSASEDGQASAEKAGSTNEIRPDVQAVLNLIGNEKADYRALRPAGYYLDLKGASLAGANLMDANLRGADLGSTNLTNANLAYAEFSIGNLAFANLRHAVFLDANLTGANLCSANLKHAYLAHANLTHADLRDADLAGAYLAHANLTDADLRDADLAGANLTDAILTGADLTGAANVTQQQLEVARCDANHPPKLPAGLVLPEPPPEPEAKSAAPPPPEA